MAGIWTLFTLRGWAADVRSGQAIFQAKCSACHTIGKGKLVGPDLQGVTERRDEAWIKKFIRNSQEMVASGDETAVALFEKYKVPMPSHDLSEAEMADLLAFLAAGPASSAQASGGQGAEAAAFPRTEEAEAMAAVVRSTSFHTLFWVVTVVAVLAYFGLAFVISGLSRDK